MWTIIKLNPKKFELLKKDFLKNLEMRPFSIGRKLNFMKKIKKK